MTGETKREGTVLVRSNHRTEPWWSSVGASLGYADHATISHMPGDGDYNLKADYYRFFREFYRAGAVSSDLLTQAQVDDVIARCRVLRWLPRRKAAAMALGMTAACEQVLATAKPVAIVDFPIDSWVTDVLERRAAEHGIPYYELTVGALPGQCMLLYRGRLIQHRKEPDPEEVDRRVHEIIDPLFTPTYVQGKAVYTPLRFLGVFAYFKVRGWFFWLWSHLINDPLNQHYLDAQGFLGHKPRLSDVRISRMVEQNWRDRLADFPSSRRLFIGLQLFPEASIDYWIDDLGLIDHEEVLLEVATTFSAAGYLILVKDHPHQFGFRQTRLLERLKGLPNVVLVPYEVSGNELVDLVDVNFTCTGALGMQSALLGKKSIVTAYYYTTPGDYIMLTSRDEIADLPRRVAETPVPSASELQARQRRIIANLLRGCFGGDYFSWQGFDPKADKPTVADLGASIGDEVAALGPTGENWHARHRWRMGLDVAA